MPAQLELGGDVSVIYPKQSGMWRRQHLVRKACRSGDNMYLYHVSITILWCSGATPTCVRVLHLQATGKLSTAQGEAAEHSRMRVKLEADIVGCRSWIRELEKTEQAYLKAMRLTSLPVVDMVTISCDLL